jgi:hypothetical protein
LLSIEGRLFQILTATIQVKGNRQTPTLQVSARGLEVESACTLPTRSVEQRVSLQIFWHNDGYSLHLQGGGAVRAMLRIDAQEAARLVERARSVLSQIVYTEHEGSLPYLATETTIDVIVHQQVLKTLHQLGRDLYEQLFYRHREDDVKAIGNLLREASRQGQLTIYIVADKFFFPWALLCDSESEIPDPERIWGFRHILEYTPEFRSKNNQLIRIVPTINVEQTARIACVFGEGLDSEYPADTGPVARQRALLNANTALSAHHYTHCRDLLTLLQDSQVAPLLYIYCHAQATIPSEGASIDDSFLELTDGQITLGELERICPSDKPIWQTAPFVFINACGSARLSPYLYGGLVPYLIDYGARGVLGTEIDTPAIFAAEFAVAFWKGFVIEGKPIGELLLELRRQYLFERNNVLGLVYALYSSCDLVIQRNMQSYR